MSKGAERVFAAAALALLTVLLHGCTNYELEITYSCSAYDATDKVCKGWTQRGTMSSAPACFPANATVITRGGPKPMSKVALGEELMGLDHRTGLVTFSPVRAWLHRDTASEVAMVRIRTDAGDFIASPFHSIASGEDGAYTFATGLKPGDAVVTAKGPATVQSISAGAGSGLYSPLTLTSNFFVADGGDGSPASSFLAHSFAHLPYPRRLAVMLHGFLSVLEVIRPDINDLVSDDEQYIHPVGRAAIRLGVPLAAPAASFEIPPAGEAQGRRLAAGGGQTNNNQEQQDAILLVTVASGGPPSIFQNAQRGSSTGGIA